uniref:Uncharacterized protein n=1 Tax=Arundo donax TaxID=35708 RepID=A0A0A9F9K4_ARUDO
MRRLMYWLNLLNCEAINRRCIAVPQDSMVYTIYYLNLELQKHYLRTAEEHLHCAIKHGILC